MDHNEPKQAYNVGMTLVTGVKRGKNVNGTMKLNFRAKAKVRGREVERSVVAQGMAANEIRSIVKKGAEVTLRVLFERAPNNDDGTPGGEFFSVIGLPRAKKAKAA